MNYKIKIYKLKRKKKCDDMQMLKFGQIIDLNILHHQSDVNKDQVKILTQIDEIEQEINQINYVWNNKIKKIRNDLHQEINKNTNLVKEMKKFHYKS